MRRVKMEFAKSSEGMAVPKEGAINCSPLSEVALLLLKHLGNESLVRRLPGLSSWGVVASRFIDSQWDQLHPAQFPACL